MTTQERRWARYYVRTMSERISETVGRLASLYMDLTEGAGKVEITHAPSPPRAPAGQTRIWLGPAFGPFYRLIPPQRNQSAPTFVYIS